MKSRLYFAGLVSICFLTYSCSNDDNFEMPEVKNNNFKITPQVGLKNELKERIIDSTTVIFSDGNVIDGDPSNPKPPRK